MSKDAHLFIRVEDDDFAEFVLLHALGHDGGRHADEEGHGRGQVVGEVPRQDGDEDVLPVHRVDQRVGGLPRCRSLDILPSSLCLLRNKHAKRVWGQISITFDYWAQKGLKASLDARRQV